MRRVVFETARLVCVDADQSFVGPLMDLFNDEANNPSIGGIKFDKGGIAKNIRSMQREARKKLRTAFRLVVLSKLDQSLIGFGSAGTFRGEKIPEIGLIIKSDKIKQGYGTELVGGLADLSLRHFGARKVDAVFEIDNVASMKILERNGFKFVTADSREFQDGREADVFLYQKSLE